MQAWRQDAHHRITFAIDGDRLPCERCVRTETPLPQRVAHDGDPIAARLILFRKEGSPLKWIQSEHGEELCGYQRAINQLRLTLTGEGESPGPKCGDAFNCA